MLRQSWALMATVPRSSLAKISLTLARQDCALAGTKARWPSRSIRAWLLQTASRLAMHSVSGIRQAGATLLHSRSALCRQYCKRVMGSSLLSQQLSKEPARVKARM